MKNSMKYSKFLKTWLSWYIRLQQPQGQEGGYILVIAMGMVLVLGGLFVTTALTSKVDTASSKSIDQSTTGFYAAEAGLNLRAQNIRETFVGYNRPTGTSPASWADCRTGPDASTGDFACQNIDDKFQAIVKSDAQSANNLKYIPVSTFVKEDTSNPASIKIPNGESFAGLNAQEYRYDVTSVAFTNQYVAGGTPQPTSVLTMSFKSRLVPLFQFAAFYENDLDFTNPAAMNLDGPIHSNGDLYLNAGSPVNIRGQLTSAGKIYRGEKITNTCNSSNPFSVIDGTFNTANPPVANILALSCSGSTRVAVTSTGANSTISALPWNSNGTLNIQPGIPRLTVPSPAVLNAQSGSEYWDKADLRISLDLDSAQNPTGISVKNADGTTNSSATSALNGSTCMPETSSATLLVKSAGVGYSATETVIKVQNAQSIFGALDSTKPEDQRKQFPIHIITSTFSDFDDNVVVNVSGNNVTLARPLGQPISVPNITGAKVRKAVVWSSKTFYNYREKVNATQPSKKDQGRLIRMLNVDMRGLMTCASTLMGKPLNEATDGGLVWFLTVNGPNSGTDITATPAGQPNNYGVKLYNGETLASNNAADLAIKGLTVSSDQAAYIQGDYNKTDKKPAAILADSINVLSTAWTLDDSHSCDYSGSTTTLNLPTCPATIPGNTDATDLSKKRRAVLVMNNASEQQVNTTINAAFLSGVDIAGGVNGTAGQDLGAAKSGGGVNNYPRLHEDWQTSYDGTLGTLTYLGSMVSLGKARRVNGPFCGPTWGDANCNIYNPPNRNWRYDKDFDDASKLPPLTPRFVYLRQERFSRDYEQQAFLPFSFGVKSWMFPSNLVASLSTFNNMLF
jgi:Tfp pilus assembly protein PilX